MTRTVKGERTAAEPLAGAPPVDLSRYSNPLSWRNKLGRVVWHLVWLTLFRPSPKPLMGWRRFLLRSFGARVGHGARPDASVRIWAPWNLTLGEHSWLGPHAECYSVDTIYIGPHAIVSQYAYLCTASHDIRDENMALITAPIRLERCAWVAAQAYVAPGVTLAEGAVAGACSVVTRDVAAWTVVAGNPAREIATRTLRHAGEDDSTAPTTPA